MTTGVAQTTNLKLELALVSVAVGDLDRSRAFYESVLGLTATGAGASWLTVGTAERPLVRLCHRPGAKPPPIGATGLYHIALHLPSRADLARFVVHAANARAPLVGFADHRVSEAVYLTDPDGHGLELYHDRPRALWQGRVAQLMTTEPLDLDSLLSEPANREGRFTIPAGTTLGHVHLKVADLPAAVGFYQRVLGLEQMASVGKQAAFLAWGGYHHHLGLNTWESRGGQSPPAGSAALVEVELTVEEASLEPLAQQLEREGVAAVQTEEGLRFADPCGNVWLARPAPQGG